MGGQSCIIKKRACNPPALATFTIPETIMDDMATGLLDRNELESAGLASFLYRCAAIDEYAQSRYNEAITWFYENVERVEAKEKPVPPPWKEYDDEGPREGHERLRGDDGGDASMPDRKR